MSQIDEDKEVILGHVMYKKLHKEKAIRKIKIKIKSNNKKNNKRNWTIVQYTVHRQTRFA